MALVSHGSGPNGTYTYAQLEGLWIQAGGPRSMAPLMAAIAEAESGGDTNARNPSGATGLWQIKGAVNPGDQSTLTSPPVNAREAVLKWKTQGLTAWTTYTSGAYKAFLNTHTTPVAPTGNALGTSATVSATGAQAALGSTCIIGFGGVPGTSFINDIFSSGGNLGSFCFFTKTEARALIGGLLLASGGLITFVGLGVLVAGAFGKPGGSAGKAVSSAVEMGGAAAAALGFPEIGAPLAAAGASAKKGPSRADRKVAAAKEEAALERRSGQPRINNNLRVGRGAIRETPEETRRRRTQRSISPGGTPATREEAGF